MISWILPLFFVLQTFGSDWVTKVFWEKVTLTQKAIRLLDWKLIGCVRSHTALYNMYSNITAYQWQTDRQTGGTDCAAVGECLSKAIKFKQLPKIEMWAYMQCDCSKKKKIDAFVFFVCLYMLFFSIMQVSRVYTWNRLVRTKITIHAHLLIHHIYCYSSVCSWSGCFSISGCRMRNSGGILACTN